MSFGPQQALRKMRIISVPLTRPRQPPAKPDKQRILTYYQFQISAHPINKAASSNSRSSRWLPKEGIAKWIMGKAANTWAGFGKAKGGWKLKTYQMGEKLVDRMDFEELALRSIDPSLGPSIKHPGGGHALEGKGKGKESSESASNKGDDMLVIPLIYPPSQTTSSAALANLRRYVERRTPRHRRGFYTWMMLTPLTVPFIIIPIIPNLPFFFCVWRSWSHYRAYKSSQYLQTLLDNNVIVPEGSEVLDGIYNEFSHVPSSTSTNATTSDSSSDTKPTSSDANPTASDTKAISSGIKANLSDTKTTLSGTIPASPDTTSTSSPDTNPTSSANPDTANPEEPQHTLLLTRDSVPLILAKFGLKESAAGADLYRAVEQARVRVESGRLEL